MKFIRILPLVALSFVLNVGVSYAQICIGNCDGGVIPPPTYNPELISIYQATQDWINKNGDVPLSKSAGLFVGVESKADPTPTNTNPGDLRGDLSATTLAGQFSYYLNATLLTGSTSSSNGGITNIDIKNSILATVNSTPNLDNYILYIAGHGAERTSTNPNEIWTNRSIVFLSNHDTFITDQELKDDLSLLPNHTNKWIFIDSCYSGGFIDTLNSLSNINIMAAVPANHETYFSRDTGILTMSQTIIDFMDQHIPPNIDIPAGIAPYGFSFRELDDYEKDTDNIIKYLGTPVNYAGFGDPTIFTLDKWNPLSYSSAEPDTQLVPEPSTFAFMAFGFGLMGFYRWRKNS